MSTGAKPWSDFRLDPREPEHRDLRAADVDRDVVAGVLTEAYADGRLSREEYDERSDTLAGSRTLGELPALLADLVSDRTPVARAPGGAPVAREEFRARAVAAYQSDRREALLGFLGPSLVCVVIWAVINWGTWDFFWPGFVMAGTLVNLLRVLVRRTDIIDEHVRSLQRKQDKALRKQQLAADPPAQLE